MEWLAAYFGFQTVNNRCVWGRCLVKQKGAASKQKVTMTTLLVAPTRHRHTENLSGEMRRYLPKKHGKGREGWEQKQLERDLSNMKKMIDLSKSATEL